MNPPKIFTDTRRVHHAVFLRYTVNLHRLGGNTVFLCQHIRRAPRFELMLRRQVSLDVLCHFRVRKRNRDIGKDLFVAHTALGIHAVFLCVVKRPELTVARIVRDHPYIHGFVGKESLHRFRHGIGLLDIRLRVFDVGNVEHILSDKVGIGLSVLALLFYRLIDGNRFCALSDPLLFLVPKLQTFQPCRVRALGKDQKIVIRGVAFKAALDCEICAEIGHARHGFLCRIVQRLFSLCFPLLRCQLRLLCCLFCFRGLF